MTTLAEAPLDCDLCPRLVEFREKNAALYPDESDNGTPMAGGNVLYRHGGGNEKSSFYMSGSTSRKDFGTANSNFFDGHAELLKQRAPVELFRLTKKRK